MSRSRAVGTVAARSTGLSRRRAWPLSLLLAVLGACSAGTDDSDGVSAIFRLDPPAPVVGTAALEVRLVDAGGEPLGGADVEIEANMNHAGMTPTFADLVESDARSGLYVGDVELTMGGDWFLLMTARLADGQLIERKLDLPGVRAR